MLTNWIKQQTFRNMTFIKKQNKINENSIDNNELKFQTHYWPSEPIL